MELRAGYKNTEAGLIPSDWEVKKLGDYSFITKLAGFEYTLHFNSYKDEGEIIVVRGTNITHNKLDLSDVRTIPRVTSNFLQRSKLFKNDLVFAYVGTIGPIFLVEEDDRFHLGPNTAKITVNKDLNSMFLFHYFTSSFLKKEIIEHTSVGAQPSLSMSKIRSFKIILPTKAEQTAIATSLSDADALISSLSTLIVKKRNIKQGAMQKLLQPKVGWEVKKFKEVFIKFPAKSYQINSSEYEDTGKFPVIDQGKKMVVAYSDNESKVFSCPKEGIIIFGDHTRILKYVNYDFVVGADGTQLLSCEKQYNTLFVFYLLLTKEIPNTGYNRHFKFLLDMEFCLPKIKEEQTRIATILSDMDTEISALETKLEKYKKLKLGMMQNLLTGKIRLV